MEYRMYSGDVPAGKNAIELIQKDLEDKGYKFTKFMVNFVGFEGAKGTKFYINNEDNKYEIPQVGHFVTPYSGAYSMHITKLVFEKNFIGNIYYIY